MSTLGEFELIRRFFADCGADRDDVVVGVGDDAAVLRLPPRHELVSTTDTLVSGVHFDPAADAADIGYKALAVNLSDLAAMGAEPRWASLALTLPEADEDWLSAFARGLTEPAQRYQVALVGGDTARGPLQVVIHLLGAVPTGQALRRSGARPGDGVYVTGQLGDAAWALESGEDRNRRLSRPEPRVRAGPALRDIASACIDVSDGLAADLGHLATASGVGATVYLETLPGAADVLALEEDRRWTLQASVGDDYELCFTAPPDAVDRLLELGEQLRLPITRIGEVDSRPGVRFRRPDGGEWRSRGSGYRHF